MGDFAVTTVSVHIAHAAFLPERKATLERLLKQLAEQRGVSHGFEPRVHRSEKREHASVWATRVYRAIAAENPDAAIVLNDDVEVSPDLVASVRQMLRQPTSRMISLHASHPMARSLAEAGQRWFATYHLTGPGYVVRKGGARELLDWGAAAPKAWFEKVNEDNVAIQWGFRNREPIWNAIPALVKHDESVPSSLGYDQHAGRVTKVAWDEEIFRGIDLRDEHTWDPPRGGVPFLETHWTDTATLLTEEIAISLGIAPMICWFCKDRPALIGSNKTGARICHVCVRDFAQGLMWKGAEAIAAQNRGEVQGA